MRWIKQEIIKNSTQWKIAKSNWTNRIVHGVFRLIYVVIIAREIAKPEGIAAQKSLILVTFSKPIDPGEGLMKLV